jgi:uncharacterized membrane protein YjfL (UPF0719 family)
MLDSSMLALALQDATTAPSFSRALLSALVFAVVGVLFFAAAFLLIAKAAPFSVRKEIEEDHNVALAIVMASIIIGIALVIGMAVRG